MSADYAIDWAIDRCIKDGVLADYLLRRRAEVRDILLTEFDMEDTARRIAQTHADELRQEGERIGEERGEERQRKAFLAKVADAVSSGALTIESASDLFSFTRDEIEGALTS